MEFVNHDMDLYINWDYVILLEGNRNIFGGASVDGGVGWKEGNWIGISRKERKELREQMP